MQLRGAQIIYLLEYSEFDEAVAEESQVIMSTQEIWKVERSIEELHGQLSTLTHTPGNKSAHVTVNHRPTFSLPAFNWLPTADPLQALCWKSFAENSASEYDMKFLQASDGKKVMFVPPEWSVTQEPSSIELGKSTSEFQNISALYLESTPSFFFLWQIFKYLSKKRLITATTKRHLLHGSYKVDTVVPHCY